MSPRDFLTPSNTKECSFFILSRHNLVGKPRRKNIRYINQIEYHQFSEKEPNKETLFSYCFGT